VIKVCACISALVRFDSLFGGVSWGVASAVMVVTPHALSLAFGRGGLTKEIESVYQSAANILKKK
jgi:hypothetical protein